jgi:hypothetical protein
MDEIKEPIFSRLCRIAGLTSAIFVMAWLVGCVSSNRITIAQRVAAAEQKFGSFKDNHEIEAIVCAYLVTNLSDIQPDMHLFVQLNDAGRERLQLLLPGYIIEPMEQGRYDRRRHEFVDKKTGKQGMALLAIIGERTENSARMMGGCASSSTYELYLEKNHEWKVVKSALMSVAD